MAYLEMMKPVWLVCYRCLGRIKLSRRAAAMLGWTLWVGGAQCKQCGKRKHKVR